MKSSFKYSDRNHRTDRMRCEEAPIFSNICIVTVCPMLNEKKKKRKRDRSDAFAGMLMVNYCYWFVCRRVSTFGL